MANHSILLAVFLTAAMATGQTPFDTAKPVDANDAIYPVLMGHQQRLVQTFERDGGMIVPQFKKWVQVESTAAKQLFPDLRFASIECDLARSPKALNELISVPEGMRVTLAVDAKANTVVADLHNGNSEAFGKLLVDRKIVLRNEADAQTIWEAFCDTHHDSRKGQPHKLLDKGEWRLGLYSYDQTIASDAVSTTVVTVTHYMRVRTDEKTGQVASWESTVDSANERRVPKKAGV